ncbi:LacI family DNA-binding transcriptional regulator [Polymorphum gilvum]|uniref:Bacterial regulatory protein LacI, HTH motif:Periplasmic binding protein/LacI transcriptional regulator n=1 Tax=Polymorphum gilvum (strain LMG 25793 / CGMCC 1.9160 / SL003B-26A1) TaxID=991905 RepID=F2IWD7_POLGS|nr:LacI family DNA-binding transcriptional regulator [Polymorphum gilvum]ADZ69236.1 Bacterial regulatory protein LacI, HTH motif:Periplasmic binding protein/LacI transcriptional regulator [Polymorphum gilvum SL003B-26A1]
MSARRGAGEPGGDEARTRRLTLGDIAEQLGISTATVSLALRDSPLVAEDTRRRVKETAHRIGYIYNRSAASLRTARTQIVGVAVHDILNPYFAEIFSALEDVLEAEGQMVFICNHRDDVARQRAFIDMLLQHRADGLILCPSVGTSAEEINRLVEQGIPVTLVCREVPGAHAPCVRGDDAKGAHTVTRHLIEQGHRKIAMVGGRRASSTGRDRHGGWRRALEEAGLDPERQIDIPELMTQADGRAVVPQVLDHADRPTAVMCFNDLIALGMMPELRRRGVEPGRDMAVTGYDDIDGAASRTPALTTVRNHPDEIGRLAAWTLLRQIAGEQVPDTLILIEPDLRVRDSSPPPGVRLAPELSR